jgi:carboxypeptidase Taq
LSVPRSSGAAPPEAWVKARKGNAFDVFAPWLEKIVSLKRREAEVLGYRDGHIYDPLLDQYEPGAKTAEIGPLLAGLRERLVPLLQAIAGSKRTPPAQLYPPGTTFPREAQSEFGLAVVRDMGFDLDAGRLDTANHPFCSPAAPSNVRLTTRYDDHDPRSCFFSIIHEAGHGLYEQGFEAEHYGTPMADAVSSGIHESQSRLWENQVARSRPFWEHYFPKLRERFPAAFAGVSLDGFHFSVNEVRPSLIRVEADEFTYNLHILLRFEIECDLLTGKLGVSELPRVWNARMEKYLGLTPPTDADGVLQDIHWSFGGFGYFPSYTLGNLYAAQFMVQARRDLPDLDDRIRRGDLRALRDWLRERIHRHGSRWRAHELVMHVTGKPLSVEPFLDYLRGKFGPLYGI